MESLRNNLPLISICLLIIGTLNLLVYYAYFDIDILSYLDLTEVFQLQFRFFSISVLCILGLMFYVLLSPRPAPHSNELKAFVEMEMNKQLGIIPTPPTLIPPPVPTPEMIVDEVAKTFEERDVPIFAVISGGAFLLNAIIWGSVKREGGIVVHILMWTALILFGIVLRYVFKEIQKTIIEERLLKSTRRAAERSVVIVCILLWFLLAASVVARATAMSVVYELPTAEVVAKLEDVTLTTNKDYRFVGKTKGYVFFYDMLRHRAESYPTDKMKSFTIRDVTH